MRYGELFRTLVSGNTNNKKTVEAIVFITIWTIWRFWINLVLETACPNEMIFDNIVDTSFNWFVNRNPKVSTKRSEWFKNPLPAIFYIVVSFLPQRHWK